MNNKLLALNMIVAEGEALLLDRCLKSAHADKAFDEIVIVNTSSDTTIDAIGNKYGAKMIHRPWTDSDYPYGNFGGARNEALRNTTCKYWMWLDTDDVVCETWPLQIERFKKILEEGAFDFFMMDYNLFYDDKGNVTTKFMRERIVKKCEDIFWQLPVHEQLTISLQKHKCATLDGMSINHKPVKTSVKGANRNLQIIEHERTKSYNPHIEYYYARELWNSKQFEKSALVFESLVDKKELLDDDLAVCCLKVAEHNLYDGADGKGSHKFKLDTIGKAETYSRLSLGFSDNYSEPFIYLGDISSVKGNLQKAVEYFKLALQPRNKGTGIKDFKFSSFVPATRLAQLYFSKKDFEQALFYTKIILKSVGKKPFVNSLRKEIILALAKSEGITDGEFNKD